MKFNPNLKDAFERDGRVWLRNVLTENDLSDFDEAAAMQSKAGQRLHSSKTLSNALSTNGSLAEAVAQLDPGAKPVRVVAFNKSEDTNWGVPWHQDRVIAVANKENVPGYRNWTQKTGTWHCEPPQHVLDNMLFVRVHLDDTDYSNGAMQIAVGSHIEGVVPAGSAEAIAQVFPIEVCQAKRGDVLVLKMLTLHSSKPSNAQCGRRVLRIDFSSSELPAPLQWISPGHGS